MTNPAGDDVRSTDSQGASVAEVLDGLGTVFAVFDERTQDSGHISYGVRDARGHRRFVKTAGRPEVSPAGASHAERVEVLRHSVDVQQSVEHRALVRVEEVVDARDGILVVQDWFDGELLRSPAERRWHEGEAGTRFRELPMAERATALDGVIDLHVALASAGWIAGDFYDGCLMYDFGTRTMKVMDFECYHRGPLVNIVGRLPGSTRYMAPEESALGAGIDERTTVFNLGRMITQFWPEPGPALAAVVARATDPTPDRRHQDVAALHRDWKLALGRPV